MVRKSFVLGALLVMVLQSAAIGSMIYKRAMQLQNGAEVVLESGFIDPRDLFRGHYVTLNLTVGDLQKDKIEIDSKFSYKDQVFVELKKGEDIFWVAKKLWHEIPHGSKAAFIKGNIRRVPRKKEQSYRITFSYDRYFAPKKRAKELEKFRRDRKLGVVLALGKNGSGAIKGITVDGEMIYDEPLY